MKRELPHWTVIHHDGWRATANDMPQVGNHRAFYEYEVTDEVVVSGRRPIAGGAGALRLQGRAASGDLSGEMVCALQVRRRVRGRSKLAHLPSVERDCETRASCLAITTAARATDRCCWRGPGLGHLAAC